MKPELRRDPEVGEIGMTGGRVAKCRSGKNTDLGPDPFGHRGLQFIAERDERLSIEAVSEATFRIRCDRYAKEDLPRGHRDGGRFAFGTLFVGVDVRHLNQAHAGSGLAESDPPITITKDD